MVKLFIVGFPRETDELQLVEMFSAHGLVNTVTTIRDQVSGISKGYAFVDMLDTPSANRAIFALDGSTLSNRTLSVRIAENKRVQNVPDTTANSNFKQPFSPVNTKRAENEKFKRPRKNRY